jgi:RecB family exonuclease
MSDPIVLSGSSINTFMRCGRQWAFAYIEKLKSPPNLKQVVGIATHKAVEVNMAQKVTTKLDLPTQDVLDVFATSYDEQLPEVEDDDDPGKAKDSGIAITRIYQTEVAPPIQPLWVEQEVQFAINDRPYSGVIDLVEERPGVFGPQHVIRDTKTTGKKPTGDGHAIAMTGYAVAFRHMTGQVESDIVLDYLVRTAKPYYLPVNNNGPISDDTVAQFGAVVESVGQAIDAGSFIPNGLQNNACSWCGYTSVCSDFKRFHK